MSQPQVSLLPRPLPKRTPAHSVRNGFDAGIDLIVGEHELNEGLTRHRLECWSAELVSVAVHIVVLVALGLWMAPSLREQQNVLTVEVPQGQELDPLESFTFEAVALEESTEIADSAASLVQRDAMWFAEPEFAHDLGDTEVVAEPIFAPASLLRDHLTHEGTGEVEHESYTSSFFGVSTQGKRFVYVLDISTSMLERTRYAASRIEVASLELLRSIDALEEDQEFQVFLFCYRTIYFPVGVNSQNRAAEPRLVRATEENKRRLRLWLSHVHTGPGTDPRWGVMTALWLKPDAVFLLSDGEFNGQRRNLHQLAGNPPIEQIIYAQPGDNLVPIHTIAFEEVASAARLQAISDATGGKHRFVGQ